MPVSRSLVLAALTALAGAACTTVPADPAAPGSEERGLVAAAHAWCERAGRPAGPPSRPFHTDGCSAFPDGRLYGCCVEHDIAYWCGGSRRDRCDADRRLRACAEVFDRSQSGLVYWGVRMGGVPWLPLPWRWGYGHPFGRGYAEPEPQPTSGPNAGTPSRTGSGPRNSGS